MEAQEDHVRAVRAKRAAYMRRYRSLQGERQKEYLAGNVKCIQDRRLLVRDSDEEGKEEKVGRRQKPPKRIRNRRTGRYQPTKSDQHTIAQNTGSEQMGRATRRKKASTRQDKDKEKDVASNVQDGKSQVKRASRHSADTEVVLSANVLNAKPERRAARIANCKIAENAKSLLSGKSTTVTSNPTTSTNRSAQSNQATTKSAHQVRTNRSAVAAVPSSRSPATATPTTTTTLNFRPIMQKAKSSTVTPHLMMTCEEDDLSEAQLDAHYKAVRAYQQFVEQLEEFKKQPDVQIVYLGPNDEIPEPPTQPIFVPITTKCQNGLTNTTSTSVSQICTATETSCSAPSAVAAGQTAQLITLTQGAPTNLQGGNLTQFMLLLDPNTRMLYSAVPTVTTAPLVAQPIGMTTASSLAPGTLVANASPNQCDIFGNQLVMTLQPTTSGAQTVAEEQQRAPSPAIENPLHPIVELGPETQEDESQEEPEVTVVPVDHTGYSASTSSANGDKEKSPKVYCVQTDLLVRMIPQRRAPHFLMAAKQEELDLAVQSLVNSDQMELEKWLLEKGLFGTARHCAFHSNITMKLMRVTTSENKGNTPAGGGGYKWWCPSCARMIPVVQGSFFARWTADLVSTLKTMYHWASCSEIVKVFRDVDMNVGFVHSVYSALRTVCSSQMGTLVLGGSRQSVEIAEETLGPCAETQQHVYAFCVYDRSTRNVILGAGLAGHPKNNIGVIANAHIHKDTTVIGDKLLLQHLPACFRDRFVAITRMESGIGLNLNAKSYLQEQVVPRLRDKCKSMRLKTIQILLDELAWRERFGDHSLAAFVNILTHIKHAYSKTVVKPHGLHSMPITSASGIKLIDDLPAEDSNAFVLLNSVSPSLASTSVDSALKNLLGKPSVTMKLAADVGSSKVTTASSSSLNSSILVYPSNTMGQKNAGNNKSSASQVGPKSKADDAQCHQAKRMRMSKELLTVSPDEDEFLNDPRQPVTSLDAYYYAWKEGDMNVIHNQSKGVFKFKCHACKKVLDNNIKLMKHMRGHIESIRQKNMDLSDLTQCKHCFRDFETPYAMQCHIEDVHLRSSNSLTCRICEKAYTEKKDLRNHMRQLHVEAEMPYVCEVCNFRSSVYRSIITHFQVVHGGTDYIQCHYCLRTFQIKFSVLHQIGSTASFFFHMHRHQTKSYSRKCAECCLTFLGPKELVAHRSTAHKSFYGREGVHRFTAFDPNNVIMVLNVHDSSGHKWLDNTGKVGEKKTGPRPRSQGNVVMQMIGTKGSASTAPSMDDEVFTCIECRQPINWDNHFKFGNSICCSKCSYTTNCGRSFADHLIFIHSDRPRGTKVRCKKLPKPMFCICGHSSSYGDLLAKHLVGCSRVTCYASIYVEDTPQQFCDALILVDEPMVCSVPASPSTLAGFSPYEESSRLAETCNEDVADSSEPANLDEQRSMLNVLGLMRVSGTRGRRHGQSAKGEASRRGSSDASSSASVDEDISLPVRCEIQEDNSSNDNAATSECPAEGVAMPTDEDDGRLSFDGIVSPLCPEVNITVREENVSF